MSRREHEDPAQERTHEREIDRTGNGIVNHGPENTANAPNANSDGNPDADAVSVEGAPETQGGGDDTADTERLAGLTALFGAVSGVGPGAGSGRGAGGGSGGSGGSDDFDGSGSDLDEVVLRRMLRGAVEGLEPGDGTLDHLKRAVPARRAKKRQAVVGAAAAVLLIGTAIPAFVHVANSDGSSTANPAIAAHGEQAQGGSGSDTGSAAGEKAGGGAAGGHGTGGNGHRNSASSPSDTEGQGADGHAADGGAGPADSSAASMPVCDPGQLGVAAAETGAAGADGTVYGSFRISNVSGKDCSVTTSGVVGFQAMGAADPAKIDVVQHTAGDAAAGLPDPSQEAGTLLLKPAMAYEVQFAWVPKDTCPTSGGSPTPTPTDGAAGTSDGTGDSTSQAEVQLGSEDGGTTLDGSVAVTHTPEPGAPVAEAKIPNACAGTIYRTGVLAPTT
ncbi:hypothetical protein OG987_21760 [Streptomyces sp. NBC_01620]|uniref:hypothetical protein n=1 Tax=Streptomyces sp. NBC_01620 TaxID=2975902 RepID=UPI00386AACDB|nr:hypothetical protein OG987_21760 [Streptomyces sp. NBC_01620]